MSVLRDQYESYEFRLHRRMLSLASADLVLSPLSLALLEKAINSSRYGSIWAFFNVFPCPPDGGESIVISPFCPTSAVRVPSDSCHLMSFDIVVGPAWGVLLVGFGHRDCCVVPELLGDNYLYRQGRSDQAQGVLRMLHFFEVASYMKVD